MAATVTEEHIPEDEQGPAGIDTGLAGGEPVDEPGDEAAVRADEPGDEDAVPADEPGDEDAAPAVTGDAQDGEEVQGVLSRARAEAEAIVAEARDRAAAEVEAARERGVEMIAEARSARDRMLSELGRRRHAAQVDLDRLRAARERLLAAYEVVRQTLDTATGELSVAEAEARAAAEEAGRQAQLQRSSLESMLGSAGAARMRRVATEAEDAAGAEGAPEAGDADRAGGALGVRPGPDAASGPHPPRDSGLVSDRPSVLPKPGPLPTVRFRPVGGPAMPRAEPASPPPPAPAPTPISGGPESPGPLGNGGATEGGADDVGALFARLRGRTPPQPAGGEPGTAAGAASGTQPESEATQAEPEPEPEPSQAEPEPSQAEPEPESAGVAASGTRRPVTMDPARAEAVRRRRDEALNPLDDQLARLVKRFLRDTQNQLLDQLRRRVDASELEGIHARSADELARVARPSLASALAAGARLVAESPAALAPDAADAAAALATEVTGALDRMLAAALSDGLAHLELSEASDKVGGLYRQWRAHDLEPTVSRHTHDALNRGAFAAVGPEVVLRWVADRDGLCPDCDDNVLAGPQPRGELFPTGQLHPPAHGGCRCLLVVDGS